MSITTEKTFETALIQSLVEQGGYTEGQAADYSPELGLLKNEVIHFLRTSQPKRWDKIVAIHGDDAENRVVLLAFKLRALVHFAVDQDEVFMATKLNTPKEQKHLYAFTNPAVDRFKDIQEEEALLSEIIHLLNERFGTEFEAADKLLFDQLEAELLEDETLQAQARVNKIDTFKYAFDDKFIDAFIGRMDQNQEIFEKVLEDKIFGDFVKEFMMKRIYKKLNE